MPNIIKCAFVGFKELLAVLYYILMRTMEKVENVMRSNAIHRCQNPVEWYPDYAF